MQLLGESPSLVSAAWALALPGRKEKSSLPPVAVRALLIFMQRVGSLLPKQALAVCLGVSCHQQLRS